MSCRYIPAGLAILALAITACKKPDQEESLDPAALLDRAIHARGGLEKLKAASSWTGNWTGISRGKVHKGTQIFKAGQIRRDFKMPNGQEVTVVRGPGACWTTMGEKLIPCSEAEKAFTRQGVALNQAAALWPLKEGDWKLELDPQQADQPSLKASSAKQGVEITLVFNKKTHLASQAILHNVTLNDQTGDLVAKTLDSKKYCGVVFFTKSLIEFAGQRIASNDLSQIECGPVDDQVFAQPAAEAAPQADEKPAEQ